VSKNTGASAFEGRSFPEYRRTEDGRASLITVSLAASKRRTTSASSSAAQATTRPRGRRAAEDGTAWRGRGCRHSGKCACELLAMHAVATASMATSGDASLSCRASVSPAKRFRDLPHSLGKQHP
jgi:hypothetical protein